MSRSKTPSPSEDGGSPTQNATAIDPVMLELFMRTKERFFEKAQKFPTVADWAVSVARGGIAGNFSYRSVAFFVSDLTGHYLDEPADLADFVDIEDYEALRAREHGPEPVLETVDGPFRVQYASAFVPPER